MRNGMIVGGGIVALIASAGIGAIAIAGDNDGREAGPRIVAEPVLASEPGPVTRGGGGATIQTFYLTQAVDPPEDGGTVLGPTCPRNEGRAIGGGAATGEGLVLSYLSQLRPANGNRSGRVFWVGVDDNSATNDEDESAVIEVHCAKGLAVKK